jgi:hypothetical protein
MFAKNCFTKFPPIHELGEFQRHPLNLTALGGGGGEALCGGALGPGVAVDTLACSYSP